MNLVKAMVYNKKEYQSATSLDIEIYERERVTGIEPALPAWKAGTLPLSYTRRKYCFSS